MKTWQLRRTPALLLGAGLLIALAACGPLAPAPAAPGPPRDTATPSMADDEMLALQQLAQSFPWQCLEVRRSPFSIESGVYHFNCTVASGHGVDVSVARYLSQMEARATLERTCGSRQWVEFHAYPSCYWEYSERSGSTMPFRHRVQVWQSQRWIFTVNVFDDTARSVAPEPQVVSEALYTTPAAALFLAP